MIRRTTSRFQALALVASLTTGVAAAADRSAAQAAGVVPTATIYEAFVRSGFTWLSMERTDASEHMFATALALAAAVGDEWYVADAERGLAWVAIRRGRYAEAAERLARAEQTFTRLGDGRQLAYTRLGQARIGDMTGDAQRALSLLKEAQAFFETANDRVGVVLALSGMVTLTAWPEEDAMIRRGIDLADQEGMISQSASLWQAMGDRQFGAGDFAAAVESYRHAETLFARLDDQQGLGRLWTSLGRLHRAHGQHEMALDYYVRAYGALKVAGDEQGVIQAVNAQATALDNMHRSDEARAKYEEALALAEATGSQRLVNFQRGNLGGHYLRIARYEQAIPLLRDSASQEPNDGVRAQRFGQLAAALYGVGRFEEALTESGHGVDLLRRLNNLERLYGALADRVGIRRALHQPQLALSDAREALAELEEIRRRLPPSDYLKRGFNQATQRLVSEMIAVLEETGRHEIAFEAAEQARARAFLDLLAARPALSRFTDTSKADAAAGPRSPAVAREPAVPEALALRGGVAAGGALPRTALPESMASSAAASFSDVAAEARRRRTTILSYWVTPTRTSMWAVHPDGSLTTASTDVTDQELVRLVRALWGGDDVPMATAAARSGGTAPSPAADPLSPRRAARELYRLLIAPVEAALPRVPGARLTIVPHGPLFRLSFAALLDGRDRYLLERYVIHYSPSASVLGFTRRMAMERPAGLGDVLLVADPSTPPALPAAAGLPPLPGARAEVEGIAQRIGPAHARVLVGNAATEANFRGRVAGASVVHVATHGVVRDDDPLGSFLVLGKSGDSADTDGVLSAEELYGLRLDARLVVLSACRSGLGEVSADGIVGLTRAVFFAGAPSIVATLWDVADGPTSPLLREFYQALALHKDAARALREAQLRTIRALRAGTLTAGADGAGALPERPQFWAGFVLIGEP